MVSSQEIETILKKEFEPVHLDIVDTSGGCGAMFELVLVSDKFEGSSLIERHRMVNDSLSQLMSDIHALSMKTWTLKQWQKKQNK